MTTAELYDELQEMFGIGDWSPASDQPWFKARMVEIGKLKRLLKSRRISTDDVHLAARFAHDNHIPIVATWQLFFLIPEAKAAGRTDQRDRIEAAVVEACGLGEEEWAARLMRVDRRDKAAVEVVLKEYEDRC